MREHLDTRGVKGRALRAAAELLAESGAEQINLRLIADRAGIGIASMYYYFKSKEDLLLNLAILGFADLERQVISYAETDPSPMNAAARGFFDYAQDQPTMFAHMFNPRLLARHRRLQDAERRIFDLFLSSVRADTRISASHQEEAALALWALGRGIAAMQASYPSGRLPEGLLERIFAGADYLIDGGG